MQEQFLQAQDGPQLQLPATNQIRTFKIGANDQHTPKLYRKKNSLFEQLQESIVVEQMSFFFREDVQVFLSKWARVAQLEGGGSFIVLEETGPSAKAACHAAARSMITKDCAHELWEAPPKMLEISSRWHNHFI